MGRVWYTSMSILDRPSSFLLISIIFKRLFVLWNFMFKYTRYIPPAIGMDKYSTYLPPSSHGLNSKRWYCESLRFSGNPNIIRRKIMICLRLKRAEVGNLVFDTAIFSSSFSCGKNQTNENQSYHKSKGLMCLLIDWYTIICQKQTLIWKVVMSLVQ